MTLRFSGFTSGATMEQTDIVVGLRDGVNTQFSFPGSGINDPYNSPLLGWSSPSTADEPAVNYISFISGLTGSAAVIKSVGTDEDVGLTITTQNNGIINLWPNEGEGYVTINNSQNISSISNDDTLSANSANILPTQYAVKQYIAGSSVETATNIAGGEANSMPYQSAPNTTTFLSTSDSAIMATTSGGVPEWLDTIPSANLPVSTASVLGASSPDNSTITAASGVYSVSKVPTTQTTTNSSFYPVFVPSETNSNQSLDLALSMSFNPAIGELTTTTFAGALSGNATSATNIAGGLANEIPYQTGAAATSFVSSANSSVLVTSSGGVPSLSKTLPSGLAIPSPKITTGLNDVNGLPILSFDNAALAVNNLSVANSSTGSYPAFFAIGSDSNIGINYEAKGSASHVFYGSTSQIMLWVNYLSVSSYVQHNISLLTTSRIITWPDASGGIVLSGSSGSGIVTSPVSSSVATAAFITSMTAGTSYQNTTGYDLTCNIVVYVTAATSATLTLGVGSSTGPTANTVYTTFTVAAFAPLPIYAYVPSGYYVVVNSTGSPTISSITVQSCPA